jgi:hypothetical protein
MVLEPIDRWTSEPPGFDPKYDPKKGQNMTQKWPKNDPKMTQKWPKNDPKMTQKWPLFGSLLGPSFEGLWLTPYLTLAIPRGLALYLAYPVKEGEKGSQKRVKIWPKKGSKYDPKRGQKWPKKGSKSDPKRGQKWPKNDPKKGQKVTQKEVKNDLFLGPFLDPLLRGYG